MTNKQKITDTSCPSCWENKNNIDEVIDELIVIMIGFEGMTDEKDKAEKRPKIIIDFLKQKLQQISDRKVEEIRGEIKENKLNYSINSNQHRQDIGFGYNKAINDTLNLKSLKIKE